MHVRDHGVHRSTARTYRSIRMALLMAMDDVQPDQIVHKPSEEFYTRGDALDAPGGPSITRTVFCKATDPNVTYAPTAFISRYDPGRISDAHYHQIDQFQVILEGKGRLA